MRIAIFGATSQIAKDLVLSFSADKQHDLVLYARRPEAVIQWLHRENMAHTYAVANFEAFGNAEHFDAILNFVGVGNPAQAAAMGASIFDVTLQYDELALSYVKQHPQCRYIFLSSGAAYGSNFDNPADANTKAVIDINHLQPQDWYGVAKLHAECRHRALPHLSIIDLRVFNYFSHTQDIKAGFLISEILRSIREQSIFKTSKENIIRDYLHPDDFYQIITKALSAPQETNLALDCYSKEPIDKITLLDMIKKEFNLQYEFFEKAPSVNLTGSKLRYHSNNQKAAFFGYFPKWTSSNGLLSEISILMNVKHHSNHFIHKLNSI